MNKLITYIDGKYVKVDSKLTEAFTPGHFKARGVFETMLAIGNQVFDLEAHCSRLQKGLHQMRIAFDAKSLPAIIRRVVKANGLKYARVRVVVWQEGRQAHVAVMALKYEMPSDKMWRVCVIKTDRAANSRSANIKSLDYQLFADAYKKAKAQGFDDALLLNRNGYIFEASRANIFWVKDGVLHTPPLSSGCLNGIMRQAIIAQAQALKIPFKEKQLNLAQFKQAQSAFLTNSLIGIKPVCTIK